ncbi:MAG: chaperone NapD [Planctomycetota bacterium]|jgi:nitrate reductase NapAB chaperone NapD
MPVSGLIVRVKAGETERVSKEIGRIPGAEVTDVMGDCIVTVTDTANPAHDRRLWKQLEELPGVIKVDGVYRNFEDVEVD